jgi:hypothetical protein
VSMSRVLLAASAAMGQVPAYLHSVLLVEPLRRLRSPQASNTPLSCLRTFVTDRNRQDHDQTGEAHAGSPDEILKKTRSVFPTSLDETFLLARNSY